MEPPVSIEKIALLVAPSYNGLPDHKKLPGTAYDLQIMKKITEKLSFGDVKEVVQDLATKENILQALTDLSQTAKPESVVLFYYSGHGFYLTSTKDEGLVPADVTLEQLSDSSLETEVCITGKDLLPFLELLSTKRVKLTVILDCCYSGQLYRVTNRRESGTKLIPRQVVLNQNSPTANKSEGTGNKKLLRGGWTPSEKDNFFHIAGCSPVQRACEEIGKGGRLTMAIETVVNSLNTFDNVSIRAFFRLIQREFKKNGYFEEQTPQLEGTSSNTELFGVKKVPYKQGVVVNDVNGDEVILDAGILQNLFPGEYSVFEATVTEAGVDLGKESCDWLGTIEVTVGHIGRIETSGFILERKPDTEEKFKHGCLAYLTTSSLKNNVLVQLTPESVSEKNFQDLLITQLKDTKLLNVSTKPFKNEDEDLITITTEVYPTDGPIEKRKMRWVARRRGDVIVPYLGLGQEETMAGNLNRYLRHKLALETAQSPKDDEELLKNVTVKVVKIEKVKPYRAASKDVRIQEGLTNGKDLHEGATQYPSLMSHSLKMDKLNDETGDAFVFQVTNHNEKKEDTVHICVLFYQFDGAIKALYPPKKGQTAELRGGDTAEDIFRVVIPQNSLRKMVQPDPTLVEPNEGIDTIVLYATSKPADFEPLLQTSIQTDPDLIPRGKEKAQALSDLAKFSDPIRKRCIEDQPDAVFKWVVEKREFAVVKNTDQPE